MEITNGGIVINRTIKKKKKKKNLEKLLARARKLQRGERVFRAKRKDPPLISTSFVYDTLITYPVDRSAIEFDLSLAREKKKGRGSKLETFSLRPYFFPPSVSYLSSRGLFLKLVGIGVIHHGAGSFSRPTLLHPIDNPGL